MIRKNNEQNYPKYFKLSYLVPHFGASCLKFSSSSAFLLATYFSEPLGGPPLGTMVRLCRLVGTHLLQISKIPEQKMAPTAPSNKQATIQKQFYRISIQRNQFLLFCLTKSRKSETQALKTIGSAELPNGERSAAPCSQGTGRPRADCKL